MAGTHEISFVLSRGGEEYARVTIDLDKAGNFLKSFFNRTPAARTPLERKARRKSLSTKKGIINDASR